MIFRSGRIYEYPLLKPKNIQIVPEKIDSVNEYLRTNLDGLNLDFRVPDIEILSILWPSKSDSK